MSIEPSGLSLHLDRLGLRRIGLDADRLGEEGQRWSADVEGIAGSAAEVVGGVGRRQRVAIAPWLDSQSEKLRDAADRVDGQALARAGRERTAAGVDSRPRCEADRDLAVEAGIERPVRLVGVDDDRVRLRCVGGDAHGLTAGGEDQVVGIANEHERNVDTELAPDTEPSMDGSSSKNGPVSREGSLG